MGYFITGNTINIQTDKPLIHKALNNQLYMDDDNTIYLCPKKQEYDGYTIPKWLAWLGGSNFEWDLRCAREHDLNCKYHQEIVVNLTLSKLKALNLLRTINNKVYCLNIPKEYLLVRNVSFNSANDKFKRMMLSATNIQPWRVKIMRLAVNLNIHWFISWDEKHIDLDKIYYEVV